MLTLNTFNSPVKLGFISFFFFFLSSDMHQSHHLIGCHATGINSSYFFKCFALFKLIMSSRKFDMNSSIRIIFIKIIIIIKVNFTKIYAENSQFISKKIDFTKIFIKIESLANKAS